MKKEELTGFIFLRDVKKCDFWQIYDCNQTFNV